MPLPKIPEAQVYEPNMNPTSFSNNLSVPVTSVDIEKAANAKFISENPYKQSEVLYKPIASTPVEQTLRYNDPSIGYSAFNPDIEQDYADKQTWYSALGSNLAQGSGRFLATFLGGFSDIPDTVESFKNGLDAFTNTTWKNNLTDWAESLSESFPVYETRYTAEHPYLSFVNPLEMKSLVNRWGTVANNLGFTAGAIANAIVTDVAVGFATGGYGETLLLPKQISKISKSIYDLGKSFEAGKSAANLAKILKSPATILQEVNQIGKTTKNITAARTALNLYNSAVGEASIEAYNTYKSNKQQLTDDYISNYGVSPDSNTLQSIDETAQAAANSTFLANTALLIGTNYLTFGKLLKPTSSAFVQSEREAIKNGIGRVSGNLDDVTMIARPKKLMSRMLNSLRTAGTESFEEGAQFTISEGSSDYWKNKYYGSDDADQLFKSIGKGVQKTLFTREGHENLIMGALSGVLINGFSSVYNGSKARLKGEKYIKNSNKDVETAINIMNSSAGLTGSISNLHNELSSSLEIEKQYKRAVESGNVELAKSLKSDLFFNWIHSANQFGRIDLRLAALDDAKLIKDEDFENFWGISYTESNAKTASNYVDLLKKKALEYKSISDSIEKAFGKNPFNPKNDGLNFRAYNDYKEALAHSLVSVKDSENRISELSSEIYNTLPNLKIDDAVELTSSQGLGKTSAKLTQKISRLLEAEANAATMPELREKIKKERVFLEEQLVALDDFRNKKNTDVSAFSKSFKNILKYLNNEDISGEFSLNDSKIEDIFEKLHAVDYLKNRALDAASYYDTLIQKGGYDKFKNKVANTINSLYVKRMDIKDGKLYIKNAESAFVSDLEEDTLVKDIVDSEQIEDDKISLDKYNIAMEKLEDGQELTEEEQTIVDNYEKVKEEKRKQVEKEVSEIKPQPVSTKIPATSVEVGDVIETMTGPIIVEDVVKTNDVVNKIVGTDINTNKEVTVINAAENPASFTVTVVENNPEVKKNKEVGSATTLENLFGNIFTYTETDEENKTFNEFNSIRAKIEDKSSKFANSIYTKYILNSPIFKFIFGDKMNISDVSVTVKKSSRESIDDNPTRITGTSFFRKSSDIDLVLNLNGRVTGFISNINSIYISRNGEFIKLVDAVKDMSLTEYLNLVKDKPETFVSFVKTVQAHKKMSDVLLSYYKEGESINVPSNVVSPLFKLAPTLVGTKIVNNSNDATILRDVKAIGDDSYIISARRTFRKTTDGNYSTKFQINVIGKNGILSEEEIASDTALSLLLNDPAWVKATVANNSRYFLLNRNPDGSFSGLSRIAARPVNTGESKLNDLFDTLKSKDMIGILDIPSQIYIADGLLPKGNGLFFQFRIDTKTGNVFLDVNKKDYQANVEQNVISVDLNDIINDSNNVSEFLNQINSEIASQQRDFIISNLTVDSFKAYIKDDKDVKFNDFLDKLTVATTPYIYNKIKLTLIPTDNISEQSKPKEEINKTSTKSQEAEQQAISTTQSESKTTDELYADNAKKAFIDGKINAFTMSADGLYLNTNGVRVVNGFKDNGNMDVFEASKVELTTEEKKELRQIEIDRELGEEGTGERKKELAKKIFQRSLSEQQPISPSGEKGKAEQQPTSITQSESNTALSDVEDKVKIKYGVEDKDLKGNPKRQWMLPVQTSEEHTNRLASFVETSDYKGREQSAYIDKNGENTEVKLRNDDGKWNWYYPKSKKPFASFSTAKDAIKFIQEQPFWDNGEINNNGRNDAYFAKVKSEQIKTYLENGNILEDINDGKILVSEAKSIIENAGLKVPKEIESLLSKEQTEKLPVVDEKVVKSRVKRIAKSLNVDEQISQQIHDIALKAKDYEDFKKQVNDLIGDSKVNENRIAEQYNDIREEAKSEYEKELERNLEDLRAAYGEAQRADTGLKKITEKSPTSVRNFINRILNGTTPETVAVAKARLVEMQRKYRKEKADMRAMLPRERGVNFVIEKLSKAARNGDISQEGADLAIDLVRKQPNLFEDLAISITKGNKEFNGDGVQGWYRAADALVKIFKNPKDELTVIHELLHHTERFLPQEVRDGIIKEWHKQIQIQAADIAKKLKTETDVDKRQQLTQGLLYLGLAEARQTEPNSANVEAMERIMSKYLGDHTDSKGNFHKGLGDTWYQLYNPSEWWAVNASKIFRDAQNKPELKTWVDKAKAFYNYLIDSAKKIFKGNPTANVEKGLRTILKGEALKDREGTMLSQSKRLLNIKQKGSFEDRLKSIYDEVNKGKSESLLSKEQTPTEDIEAKKAEIERRRQEELDNLFSETQASTDKQLNTPVQKLSKEEVSKNIETAKQQNKDLIEELENPEFLNDEKRNDEWDKKADELSDKLPQGVSFRITDGKVDFFDSQSYREKGFGKSFVQVSVGDLHNKTEKFEVGDNLQVQDGVRAMPAIVTKVNEHGKILEAKQGDGRIIISRGNIITLAPINDRLKINAKYDAELKALEQKQSTSNVVEEKNVKESLENTEKIRIFGVNYGVNDTLEVAKAKLLVDNIETILRQLSSNKTITITKCK